MGAKLFVCASTQQQTANGFVGAMAILVILNSDVMTTPNYTSATNIIYFLDYILDLHADISF